MKKILEKIEDKIFQLQRNEEFEELCFELLKIHYQNNPVYRNFCDLLEKHPKTISSIYQIPFLPVEFFKTKKVFLNEFEANNYFSSSATTGAVQSRHYYHSLHLYERSFIRSFELLYGDIGQINFLCLLPSYLEREGSSLIYMAQYFIDKSRLNNKKSAFFLNDFEALKNTLDEVIEKKEKFVLLGVSFALLDFAEQYQIDLSSGIIMETGGMKGRRKELVREELHTILKTSFKVNQIHSEYGMTELLSQGYSKGLGIYECPAWMKILIRENTDPFSFKLNEASGCINVIDLANMYSCPFIATQDIGKKYTDNTFEVLGRMDQADLRGCNLMVL